MATRFWLTSAAPPYTPATRRGAWDTASGEDVQLLGRKPQGSAGTSSINVGSTGADRDVLLHRSISAGAVKAGTLSGTVSWTIGVRESNVDCNAVWHLHIYVTSGDSDTPRGTLLADHIGATEFTTTATGSAVTSQAVNSVAVQTGDCIVVEIGYRANSLATTYNATINYGNTGGTDLSSGSTNVTVEPGWVEFSGADGLFTASFSTLTDAFASSIDSKWTKSAGVTATGGRARIPTTTTLESMYTATAYELQGGAVAFQVPTVPATGGGSGAFVAAYISAGPTVQTTNLEILYTPATSNLQFRNNVGGADGAPTNLTYDSTAHKWWRFREASGSITMDTSPDGATWTTRRTISTITQWMRLGTLILYLESQRTSGTADFTEIDNVNVSTGTSAAFGTATETDSAVNPTGRKTKALSTATETDTAIQPGGRKAKTLGVSTETDQALQPGGRKTKTLGTPGETDAAIQPTGRKASTLAAATETDAAVAPAGRKTRTLGAAAETDTAQTLTGAKQQTLATGTETDTALAPAGTKRTTLSTALETDVALAGAGRKSSPYGTAAETDQAISPTTSSGPTLGTVRAGIALTRRWGASTARTRWSAR